MDEPGGPADGSFLETTETDSARAASAGAERNLELRLPSGPVPLGFVREGPVVFLVARDRAARWPVVILREAVARLVVNGERLEGKPRLITDPKERDATLDRFLQKYGAREFERWYSHPARVLAVDLTVHPDPGARESERYSDWLRSEFDNVADDYDRHILGNRINRLLRDRSLAHMSSLFAGKSRLLEVGCGSGMETLPLMQQGHEIVAVDLSERMLEVVRRKASALGLSNQLTTIRARASELEEHLESLGRESFDGAYSTYGALNCEPDLRPVARAIHEVLKPGASFVTGVYNRWCLFEILGYSFVLKPSRARSRFRNPIEVGDSRFCVDVYAYSVGDLRRTLEPSFSLRRVEAVPVLLPPSDLAPYADRFARRFGRLARWDAWAGQLGILSGWGDHFLATWDRH